MTHRVGIYYGGIVLYRGRTRITVGDSETEFISQHVCRNYIRNNETRLSRMMNKDIFPRTTRLYTVLQHSLNCKNEFRKFQYINFALTNHVYDHITHKYSSMTKNSELITEQSHYIAN